MTYFYTTKTWTSQPQISEETIKAWKHLAEKKNWRIVQLPNGFFQTEYQDIENTDVWHDVTRRETIEGAEAAIDGSIEHYGKKIEFVKGPKVVKTFK
jgi:hypothetical protein|tara:strand:+ start:853 stop:1143 length:291 start_codon:yes stop_codon:yes gene_type:complete